MKFELSVERIEENHAILKTEDKQSFTWPKNKLPNNIAEGMKLVCQIDSANKEEKSDIAKDILNEILDTEA